MRNLTIKRNKSFVGCLGKMKIYIEDWLMGDTKINDIPCRKIGDLKNGEVKTFSVPEEEIKIFVIADKLSKGFCNEFYKLPSGDDDVFLSGQNRFNPANGNAFRFDGVTDEEILTNRKKASKKGVLILCLAFAIGIVGGFIAGTNMFSEESGEPKTFTSNGMNITLTSDFKETNVEGYTVCYDSEYVGVIALKEEFGLVEGFSDYTIEEYGNLVIENNKFDSSIKLQNKDGLTYFSYEFYNAETKTTYYYFSVLYKSSDAFWMIQFTTPVENIDIYSEAFIEWAKSVNFSSESI